MLLEGNQVPDRRGFPLPLQRGIPKLGTLKIAGILVLAGLATTVLAMSAKGPDILSAKECRTAPRPIPLADEVQATMAIRGNVPCPIIPQLAAVSVNGLDITVPPNNGRLTSRGRTGFVYHPNSRFRGQDSFEFAMHGRSIRNAVTRSIVKVRVNVD